MRRGCELDHLTCAGGRCLPAKATPGRGRLMTELQYSTGSFRVSRARTVHSPQQRVFGIAFAIAMEAAIIYALLVALGYAPAPPKVPGDLIVVNVPPPAKPTD